MKSADQPEIIPLWQESAPGEEFLQEQETPLPGNRVVRNVSQPTLMAFLPDPSVAVGTAVIICPGGAFHFLSIESEGIEVARWLNQRGIAAFLLKYRLIPTAERDEAFLQQVQENVFSGNFPRLMNLMMQQAPLASADGRQPSNSYGSEPQNGASCPTESASWASPPEDWLRSVQLCSLARPRALILQRFSILLLRKI